MKKQIAKWLTALGLVTALSLGTVQLVMADGDQVEEVQMGEASENGFIPAYAPGGVQDEETVELYGNPYLRTSDIMPSSYDLRTTGQAPELGNQKGEGLCWAFSAAESGESGLIFKTGTGLNLSEVHLAWTNYNGTNSDAGDGTKDETYNPYYNNGTKGTWQNVGGNLYYSTATFMRWYGAVSETEVPFSYSEYSDLTGLTEKKNSLSHLENAWWLPQPVKSNGSTDMTAIEVIKNFIKNYGAVELGFNSDSGYDSSTNSYYHSSAAKATHSIVLIGWDDEKETKAGDKGAFLMQNSWGESWGDGGYGWISYYDKSITDPAFYEFEQTLSGEHTYTINQQYDGLGYGALMSGAAGSGSRAGANVFTAAQDQSVEAVSFFSPKQGLSYEINVYRNVKGAPNTGELVESACTSGYNPYMGYYTVPLNSVVEVAQGEKYAVTVDLVNTSLDAGYVALEPSGNSNNSFRWEADCQPGQSYIWKSGREWQDVMDMGAGYQSNVCIKALGNPAGHVVDPVEKTYKVTFSSLGQEDSVVEVKEGETVAKYTPAYDDSNYVFYWWCTDETYTVKYDFTQPITEDTTVYARWGRWEKVGSRYRLYNIAQRDKYLRNIWYTLYGKTYYFNAQGYRTTGWLTQDKKKYFFTGAGVLCKGWKKGPVNWYYFDPKTGAQKTGWLNLSEGGTVNTYYLNPKKNGIRYYGWLTLNGKRYFLNSKNNGILSLGWVSGPKNKYYFEPSGSKRGQLVTGWKKISGNWYYFKSSGIMTRGWLKVGGKTYYLKPNGVMVTGKFKVDGKYYTFNADGSLKK